MWGNIEIRVLAVTQDNCMSVTSNTNSNWTGTTMMASTITNSALVAVMVAGTANSLRLYYQPSGAQISEYGSDNGQSWIQMAQLIPTSN
jgi:hypothetical protein